MIHKIINPTKITHYTVDKSTGDIELRYSYNKAQAIICCINELGSVVNDGHIASAVVTTAYHVGISCYSIYKIGIYLRKKKKCFSSNCKGTLNYGTKISTKYSTLSVLFYKPPNCLIHCLSFLLWERVMRVAPL